MLPSAQEHYKDQNERQAVDLAQRRRQITVLAQAEVLAENLTQVREWDLFLSYVQAGMNACDVECEKLRRRISDPMVVQTEEIMRLKVLLEGWEQRRNAFQAVISLPKDLIEMGQEAKSLLERLPQLEKPE